MSTIIDGKDLILGRLASNVAQLSLHGEDVTVINIEKTVITGRKEYILERYAHFRDMGRHNKGPFLHRTAEGIFKHALKGMLPHKCWRGRQAMQRVKAYKGTPASLPTGSHVTLPNADISKLPSLKYLRTKELVELLGGK